MEQRAHFSKKLEDLRVKVLRMAALSESAVHKAIKAYLENDSDLAEAVIVGDDAINEMEDQIDNFCLELLALDQPMAVDLRTIIGAQRITVNLERLGDEAVNLAHRAMFLASRPPMPHNPKMENLANIVKLMLSEALKAYVDDDVTLAGQVCRMDDKADDLNISILRQMVAEMVSESRIVERGVHAIIGARHLERIGDLATNVAESVVFIVEGTSMKHNCRG
ncbi:MULTISPECIES: phosphate signaling complex protein PhoU [unclassified Pseudodesulfovibrio]|uniref:phosphate signaling complex protein PhoU n=1 Tax=unclassified Pseudodesulfovibrio TaxID=2661612 RepID=UPI000FEB5D10|nr:MULTISPECIES: phosphate signaling complex protein PhoU [unclassified Pseudodesulfovibrio]MCJ2165452.1 phosphate signaling complex protein PhoU [Pseudodesulfovibrio sp. S3-i]RWU03202.1 phosphate transport system regulatory protein PhoU [Pseudodesulfovibrio sp. S3]